MSENETKDEEKHPFRPEELDLSKLTVEQLTELRDATMARLGEKVSPEGFAPHMMATDVGPGAFAPHMMATGFIGDDLFYVSRWDWLTQTINMAFRRVGLAVLSAGFGLTAANLHGSTTGGGFAPIFMVASGVSAVWFVVDMIRRGKMHSEE